jgi:hypothetical protein
MEDNFKLFDKYPHYVFNFSGANRCRLMKEYFPADFSRLKKHVDEGRWFPVGSSMEEGDVNAPSAEGIIRQILYGNDWFRKELGKASAEYTGRNDKPDSRPKAPSKLAYGGKSRPWRSRFRNDDGLMDFVGHSCTTRKTVVSRSRERRPKSFGSPNPL